MQAEEWRPVPGWDAYEVSSLGRVKRVKAASGTRPGAIRKTPLNEHGYPVVMLRQDGRHKGFLVHRLVCEAFIGPQPDGRPCVAHNDGNPLNCTPENLRWASQAENLDDCVRHGTRRRGERSPLAKLNERAVAEIKAAAPRKGYLDELAEKFGVSKSAIKHVRYGHRWSYPENANV